MKTLTIRISDEEHALMSAAAAKRFMTITGMVRAHFHSIFEADGVLPHQKSAQQKDDKPQVTRVSVPTGVNAWRDEIYRRSKAGEPVQLIADSYGVHADVIRQKINTAKLEEKVGAAPSTHNQPLPEYNPVDPDNPTLEEQKANAERARIQLENLGFSV